MKEYKIYAAAVLLGVLTGILGYQKPEYKTADLKQHTNRNTARTYTQKENVNIILPVNRSQLLLKYNIFSENRSFEMKTVPAGFKDLPDLKTLLGETPPAELRLVGIAVVNGEKIAYLSDSSGKLYPVKEGGTVADKYKIVSIDKDKVKLLYEKQEKVLKIFDFGVQR